MVLKLHGMAMSTCTRRVLFTANEVGLKVELVSVDFAAGEHKKPAFLKMQPFGQIPVLEDDGFFVYESRAIAQYLCDKAGAKGEAIYPKDAKKRAIVNQMISVETSNYNPSATALVVETVFKGMKGLKADPVKVEESKKSLCATLDVYNGILNGKEYLAGDFSLADIFHAPYGACCPAEIFTDAARPNVNRWWKTLTARPAWVSVTEMK